MSKSHEFRQKKLLALILAVATPAAFLISLPWLRHGNDTLIFLLGGLASTVTIGASLWLSMLKDKRLDEWQKTGARFGSQWGWILGSGLVIVSLAVPPVQDGIVSLAATFGEVAAPDRQLVLMTFLIGLMSVVLVQTLCITLLNVGWKAWSARENV